MLKKSLQKKIAKKLTQLDQLINQINDVQVIDPTEPETWDTDTLSDLVANLKEALAILEDKVAKGKYDSWGEPLILATGLISLIEEYQSEEEDF